MRVVERAAERVDKKVERMVAKRAVTWVAVSVASTAVERVA